MVPAFGSKTQQKDLKKAWDEDGKEKKEKTGKRAKNRNFRQKGEKSGGEKAETWLLRTKNSSFVDHFLSWQGGMVAF